jgi:hypothetical protein
MFRYERSLWSAAMPNPSETPLAPNPDFLTAGPNDTPFVKFWSALNEELRGQGLGEVTFGTATVLWSEAVRRAKNRVTGAIMGVTKVEG